MTKLVILGTSGNSREILDAIIAGNQAAGSDRFQVLGFLDDDAVKWGTLVHGVPVLGGLAEARRLDGAVFVNGIGGIRTYKLKQIIIAGLDLPEARFATVRHPSAVVSSFAVVGAGTVLLANVVVGSDAKIGRHVQVLPLGVLSHDVEIGDFATIAGGVAIGGNVRLGRCCYIGTNAAIRNGVTIGDEALVGMGAVVLKDVRPGAVVVGVPAAELVRG